jgi:hypothetical protein
VRKDPISRFIFAFLKRDWGSHEYRDSGSHGLTMWPISNYNGDTNLRRKKIFKKFSLGYLEEGEPTGKKNIQEI